MSTANMNIRRSKKYGVSPEEVEKKALQSERFEQFIICTDKINKRQDRYDKKNIKKTGKN